MKPCITSQKVVSLYRKLPVAFFACTLLCFVSPTTILGQNAAGYTWSNVAMGGGGFVSAIVTNKTERNLVYARTDVGGAYRWDNASGTWIPLVDWASVDQTGYLGVESLASDPQTPANVYLLAGISYFNGGRTAILRYGGVFTLALAYAGTSNNNAIRQLLHIAVSDTSDDVRRAAVVSLAFVLFKNPAQVPRIVQLLSESYNPHVRCGATLALGIACAGTGLQVN